MGCNWGRWRVHDISQGRLSTSEVAIWSEPATPGKRPNEDPEHTRGIAKTRRSPLLMRVRPHAPVWRPHTPKQRRAAGLKS